MKQDLYIQMICENTLEEHVVMQNSKRIWISDDIWKSKLESCNHVKRLTGKTTCKKSIGLIGIIRGTFK